MFFTGLASAIVASSIYGYDLKTIILVSLAIIFGVIGSNATTAYIDREMDGIMERTRNRPVPSGALDPPRNALIFGLFFVAAGIVTGAFVNYLSSVFIFIGFIDSAIIYNAVSKRKSPLNVLLGAPAGGIPVLAGWVAVSGGRIGLLAIMMFTVVIIWTPIHIWSLAYFYRADYRKAKVPMLPVIWKAKKIFILIAALNILLVAVSLFIGFYFRLSMIYIGLASALGIAIIAISLTLSVTGKESTAWLLFKFSSPYLGVVFLLLLVEYVLL